MSAFYVSRSFSFRFQTNPNLVVENVFFIGPVLVAILRLVMEDI